MKRFTWSLLTLSLFCGLNVASSAEPATKQESKSAQLYYQNGVNPNFYQSSYGYAPQVNQPVRQAGSQVCIPGVGCGTFYPTTNTQINPYGNVSCGPSGCYLNQQPSANYGCSNGQCGTNSGYYNGYNPVVPPRTVPVVPPQVNYGYPTNYGYPNGMQYSQPVYPQQQNNYGVQYLPVSPFGNTPVFPNNFVAQINSQTTGTNTAATTNSNLKSNNNSDSPYFK